MFFSKLCVILVVDFGMMFELVLNVLRFELIVVIVVVVLGVIWGFVIEEIIME